MGGVNGTQLLGRCGDERRPASRRPQGTWSRTKRTYADRQTDRQTKCSFTSFNASQEQEFCDKRLSLWFRTLNQFACSRLSSGDWFCVLFNNIDCRPFCNFNKVVVSQQSSLPCLSIQSQLGCLLSVPFPIHRPVTRAPQAVRRASERIHRQLELALWRPTSLELNLN